MSELETKKEPYSLSDEHLQYDEERAKPYIGKVITNHDMKVTEIMMGHFIGITSRGSLTTVSVNSFFKSEDIKKEALERNKTSQKDMEGNVYILKKTLGEGYTGVSFVYALSHQDVWALLKDRTINATPKRASVEYYSDWKAGLTSHSWGEDMSKLDDPEEYVKMKTDEIPSFSMEKIRENFKKKFNLQDEIYIVSMEPDHENEFQYAFWNPEDTTCHIMRGYGPRKDYRSIKIKSYGSFEAPTTRKMGTIKKYGGNKRIPKDVQLVKKEMIEEILFPFMEEEINKMYKEVLKAQKG